MPPEPLAVMDLSSDMVVKLRLNVEAETVAADADAVPTWPAMAESVRTTDADAIHLAFFEISICSPLLLQTKWSKLLAISAPAGPHANGGAVATGCSASQPGIATGVLSLGSGSKTVRLCP